MNQPRALSPKIKTPKEMSPMAEDKKKSNSTNKFSIESSVAKSYSPKATSKDDMEIDNGENESEGSKDPLQNLQSTELLPELFHLLNDLQNGEILAKDFDNNAGSIRLKLTKMRQDLQEVPGINESIEYRESRIQNLKNNNMKKVRFLKNFKETVESELNKS